MKIHPEQIGFDFDGVIADIGEAFLRLACKDHNYCSLTIDQITSFQVESCTLIPEVIVQTIFTDILLDSLKAELLPIKGALDGLTKLTQQTEVTIITARRLATPVIDWLDNYLPATVCSKIQVIAMGDHDKKVQYIKDAKLHFFVDDRGETCAQVAEAGLIPLLFRQPWNRSWNDYPAVASWQDIEELIERS